MPVALLAAIVAAGCGGGGPSPISLDSNRDTKGKPSKPAVDTSPKVIPRGQLPTEPASDVMRRACRRYVPSSSEPLRCLGLLPEASRDVVLQGGRDYEQPDGAFLFALRMGNTPPSQVTLTFFGGVKGGLPLTESGGEYPAEADLDDVGDILNIVGYGPLDPNDADAKLGPNSRPQARGRTTVEGRPAMLVSWREQPTAGTVHATNDGIVFNQGGSGWLVSLRFKEDVDREARVSLLKRVAASLSTLDSQEGGGST